MRRERIKVKKISIIFAQIEYNCLSKLLGKERKKIISQKRASKALGLEQLRKEQKQQKQQQMKNKKKKKKKQQKTLQQSG